MVKRCDSGAEHSYDYPPIAKQGLPAAFCYAGIAPDSAHALHMPSHIFTGVGLWRESIDTNTRSVTAAQAEHNLGSVLHAMDYMVYADLQLGRDAQRRRGGQGRSVSPLPVWPRSTPLRRFQPESSVALSPRSGGLARHCASLPAM